jgi:hypothetical protein
MRRITPHAGRQARQLGLVSLTGKTLACRWVRVVRPNGRSAVSATALRDASAVPANAFASLYQARWRIEEAFKLLKQRLLVEQFTGELPESIRQDFHAKVFTANLAAALAAVANESLPEAKAQRYPPNFADFLENLRNRLFWVAARPVQRPRHPRFAGPLRGNPGTETTGTESAKTFASRLPNPPTRLYSARLNFRIFVQPMAG